MITIEEENMGAKAFKVSLLCALFAISLCMSCSSEKEKKQDELHDKIVKERAKTSKVPQNRTEDESEREKQIAIADACSLRYGSCLEKCNSSTCEDACQNALSVCEKDLPSNLKTIEK